MDAFGDRLGCDGLVSDVGLKKKVNLILNPNYGRRIRTQGLHSYIICARLHQVYLSLFLFRLRYV
jgi:hypothetical protein